MRLLALLLLAVAPHAAAEAPAREPEALFDACGWVYVGNVGSMPAAAGGTARVDLWLERCTGALGVTSTTIEGSTVQDPSGTPTEVPVLRTSWKTTLPGGGVLENVVETPKPASSSSSAWAKKHAAAVAELMELYPPDPPGVG